MRWQGLQNTVGVARCYTHEMRRKMKSRCTPQSVKKAYRKARSWRKAAQELNLLYGVNLPHLAWRDYGFGRRDISDPEIRAALLLGPRTCPTCGNKPSVHFSRLLKRLKPTDLKRWQSMRSQKKYKAAKHFLDEVYSRSITKRRY